MSDLSSFHDVSFPTAISFGATGGPEWRNEIVSMMSGHEKRNARWSMSRRAFDAGTGLRSLSDLREILSFFEARRGSLYGFRFRDPFDHLSSDGDLPPDKEDQLIGYGDGSSRHFQLTKAYGGYQRIITKPVTGTVKISLNGQAAYEGGKFQR